MCHKSLEITNHLPLYNYVNTGILSANRSQPLPSVLSLIFQAFKVKSCMMFQRHYIKQVINTRVSYHPRSVTGADRITRKGHVTEYWSGYQQGFTQRAKQSIYMLKVLVFADVTPCRSAYRYQSFKGACCHLEDSAGVRQRMILTL